MAKYKYSARDTRTINKFGVDITLYDLGNSDSNIVYEEVEEGHFEEFLSTRSTYSWFIIEGAGTFVIDDERIPVSAHDIITVPPHRRIHYFGRMKMLLITVPAFDADYERHIREIGKEESPYFQKE